MAVDTQNLEIELNNYGNVIFCNENNIKSFIIVVENLITDVTTIKTIIDRYLLNDFQILKDIRLSDGKLKCLYVKS